MIQLTRATFLSTSTGRHILVEYLTLPVVGVADHQFKLRVPNSKFKLSTFLIAACKHAAWPACKHAWFSAAPKSCLKHRKCFKSAPVMIFSRYVNQS